MTLDELKAAIDEMIQQGIEADEPVCIDVLGECYQLNSITVVVKSDAWVPGTVVMTATPIGEADDG